MKELHIIVKALNKVNNEPGYCIFGFEIFYCFTILDEGRASLGNGNLITEIKENATLIKNLGPGILILMIIAPIVVQYLNFLRLMLILIFSVIIATLILQEKTTFEHVLIRKVGK